MQISPNHREYPQVLRSLTRYYYQKTIASVALHERTREQKE